MTNKTDVGEIAVSRDKIESFAPLIGIEVTDENKLRDKETGEILTSREGEE